MRITLNENNITVRGNNSHSSDNDDYFVDEIVSKFEPGDIGTIGAKYNQSPNSIRDGNSDRIIDLFIASKEGIPGNMNQDILMTDGWRGTTNEMAIYAHGLVKILFITKFKRGYGFKIGLHRI